MIWVTQGHDLKVAVNSETFSAYLKDKNKTLAAQMDKDNMGMNQFNYQNQYNMMMNMNMQFMNMFANPQMQMMFYQWMANPYGQGAFTGFSGQKNNLFVRKAKTKESSPGSSEQKRGEKQFSSNSSRGGNFKGDREVPYSKKFGQEKLKNDKEKEDSSRQRLDSDNFPSLSGPRKQILSDPKVKEREVVEGKVTRQYLIDYFTSNKGNISISETLSKLNTTNIPIIDKAAELRIEELNPTPRKDYYGGAPHNPNSGPSSRKGSVNYRKGSFNQQQSGPSKKRGAEDEEYVAKTNDN